MYTFTNNLKMWKFRRELGKYTPRAYVKYGLGIIFIVLLVYYGFDVFICWQFYFGSIKQKFVCMQFSDRLANQMFQFTFAYSVAKEFKRELIVPEDSMLIDVFDVEPNTWYNYGLSDHSCRCLTQYTDQLHCGYDPRSVDISKDRSVNYEGYFQSWVYFKKYEDKIRQIFTFKTEIRVPAKERLNNILKSKGVSRGDGTVLVGIHVRYFDEYYNSIIGKRQAPKSYITKAVNYFRTKYKKILFIVGTNSRTWTKRVLDFANDTVLLQGNSAPIDMAILTQLDHTIMTVGSFGWFIGWLTGGTTVYYKNPDEPGTKYFNQFNPGKADHFNTGWIGFDE